ncbi:PepSY domain-containing protein [Hyphomicrobium sp.]|uniref:PepSY domain-containing protein n=1 Tax=Hyphomicrobium sp. TaxID=82 RepID=UPI0022CA61EB|nr:PepSY domain-containing protein [Hyphomicrobium sp.]MCZ7593523.1 PepSY domain-containing protein [Hyphomicrobium sp.]
MPAFLRRHLIAAMLALAAGDARADDVGPEVARQLLSEGRIRPLAEILDAVKAAVPGEMVEVELELDDGTYVYEVKQLRPDGRVQEVKADAATGKILKIEDDD